LQKVVVAGVGFPDVIRVIDAINDFDNSIEFHGFLDDNKELNGKIFWGYPILGPLEWIKDNNQEFFVVSTIALTTKIRYNAHLKLKKYGARFTNLIHPMVDIRHVKIGRGVIMCQGSTIGPNTTIEDQVIVSWNSNIGHDSTIGKYSFIAAGASILGHVQIGKGVMIGANSSCYPKIIVDDWSTVGMSSCVIKNVNANTTVLGNPARKIF